MTNTGDIKDKEKDMLVKSENLLRKFCISLCSFSGIMLAIMLVHLMTRSVVISGAMENDLTDGALDEKDIDLQVSDFEKSDTISIEFDSSVSSSDISIENHYFSKEMYVIVKGNLDIEKNIKTISKNVEGISASFFDDITYIKFELDDIYEYSSSFCDMQLNIGTKKPADSYENIVVIDPIVGDDCILDKDCVIEIANNIEDSLEELNIKAYILLDEYEVTDLSQADKIAAINSINPDFTVVLTEGDDFVTYYNDIYLRNYDNLDFAKQIAADISYELGLDSCNIENFDIEEYDLLNHLSMPSAYVEIVCGGKEENKDSNEKIADAITKAIGYAYQSIEEIL